MSLLGNILGFIYIFSICIWYSIELFTYINNNAGSGFMPSKFLVIYFITSQKNRAGSFHPLGCGEECDILAIII